MGSAMRGLVSAEGDSQKALSNATQQWSRGIANAYQGAAQNGALFPVALNSNAANSQVAGLYASLRAGGTIDQSALDMLDPTHPANSDAGEEGGGTGSSDPWGGTAIDSSCGVAQTPTGRGSFGTPNTGKPRRCCPRKGRPTKPDFSLTPLAR